MRFRTEHCTFPRRYGDNDRRYQADPWDVSWGVGSSAEAAVVDMKRWWRLLVWLLPVPFLVLLISSSAWSQAAPPDPPNTEAKPERVKVVLKSEARDLARDYLELLDQVQTLTDDYTRYYGDFQQARADALQKELSQLSSRLIDSSYFSDLTRLNVDLANLQYELQLQLDESAKEHAEEKAAQEKSHAGSDEPDDPRMRQLTRSLRRDLALLSTQLEGDLARRFESSEVTSKIVQQYIKAAIVASTVRDDAGRRLVFVDIGRADFAEPLIVELDLKALGELTGSPELAQFYEVSTLPEVPDLPQVRSLPDHRIIVPRDVPPPAPPLPLAEIGEKKITYHDRSGEAGMTLQIVDSARTTSVTTPMYVVNPFGTLEVEGWDRPWIVVDAEIEIAAKTTAEAEALSDRIGIRIHNKTSAVYVETVIPQLSDPHTKVVSVTVVIKAPKDNPLSCRSSHGALFVTGFDNGVRLNADHSAVELRGVVGSVEAVNSMGRLVITDVDGRLELRNAYDQIKVSRCRGDMTLDNAFGSIEMYGCTGDVKIRNSGVVEVEGHSGQVEIYNNKGAVTVRDLDGDLLVASALSPMIVENISGSAGLENVRGGIEVSRVMGPLSATNTHGTITAGSLRGPLRLVNSNGLIELDIDRDIVGRSSISADHGSINLRLDKDSDLLLLVETFGGEITSSFSAPIQKTDSSSSARFEFGRMANSLDVSGRSSDVVISGSR